MTRNLIRLAGVVVLLVVLFVSLQAANPNALDQSNLYDVFNRHGALGIITIGAALLIITGGIDLSIGSVVGFGAILFGVLMEKGFHPYAAMAIVLLTGPAIGTIHALLVTKLRLQPFLVTLCGMFIYRGIARGLTAKNTGLVQVRTQHAEFGTAIDNLRSLLVGKDADGALVAPAMLAAMLALAVACGVVLHFTAYGRYWYAIGQNEKAAEYAGVRVHWQKGIVYVICSTFAVFAGILYLLNNGSAAPDNVGSSFELYAITAAVLGGCSLRGGHGLMLGIVLGSLVVPVINNWMVFKDVPSWAEPCVMGTILLVGTIADELIRRGSKAK